MKNSPPAPKIRRKIDAPIFEPVPPELLLEDVEKEMFSRRDYEFR
jgi:hypothetical protein